MQVQAPCLTSGFDHVLPEVLASILAVLPCHEKNPLNDCTEFYQDTEKGAENPSGQ